jgi:hypothetical protein
LHGRYNIKLAPSIYVSWPCQVMNAETGRGFSYRKILAILAALGFAVSLVVHLATYLGVNVSRHVPAVWLLHVGVFIVFVPMVITIYTKSGKSRPQSGGDFWRQFFNPMPRWVRLLSYGLFAYVAINFILFVALSRDGSPDVIGGKYVLRSDGRVEEQRVIREITMEEYDLREARVVRGFSGHWLVFYLIAALYFWYGRKEAAVN